MGSAATEEESPGHVSALRDTRGSNQPEPERMPGRPSCSERVLPAVAAGAPLRCSASQQRSAQSQGLAPTTNKQNPAPAPFRRRQTAEIVLEERG